MHNSILEYASTTSISIVMTKPFHVMPFERRFLKKWFSPQISSKPPTPQETENRKKKKRKKEEKGKRKRKRKKASRVSNKRGSQYFERRKTL
jgi:hypothetical protein